MKGYMVMMMMMMMIKKCKEWKGLYMGKLNNMKHKLKILKIKMR